jgi:hypothetical protein
MLQNGRSRFRIPIRWIFQYTYSFRQYYDPGVYSASKRNECQESTSGVKGDLRVRLTNLPPSVSRLSRENLGTSTSHNLMGLHGLLERYLYIIPYLYQWVQVLREQGSQEARTAFKRLKRSQREKQNI